MVSAAGPIASPERRAAASHRDGKSERGSSRMPRCAGLGAELDDFLGHVTAAITRQLGEVARQRTLPPPE